MSSFCIKTFLKDFIVESQKVNDTNLIVFGEKDGKQGIITISLKLLDSTLFADLVASLTKYENLIDNDVFSCYMAKGLFDAHIRVIYPASSDKIVKYKRKYKKLYTYETPDEYANEISKLVNRQKNVEWIKNVITHSNQLFTNEYTLSEKFDEKIFYTDNEFVITTNYKWNGMNTNELYLLLLFKQEFLYTIREVVDVDYLIRAKQAIYKTLSDVYKMKESDVILFFHYHPTYYSLHLHIVNINMSGEFLNAGRVILLDKAIEMMTIDPEYYKKATLPYIKHVNIDE